MLACEADLESQGHEFQLTSPNLRALIPSANFAPMSRVKGVSLSADIAYAASVPKGTNYAASVPKDTNKVPSREAEIEALCNSNSIRRKAKNKAPLCAKAKSPRLRSQSLLALNLRLGAELQV